MSQEVSRESAGEGEESLMASEIAARPLVRDFCQSPWKRIVHEIWGAGVILGFFCGGREEDDFVSGRAAGTGLGFIRWSPAAIA